MYGALLGFHNSICTPAHLRKVRYGTPGKADESINYQESVKRNRLLDPWSNLACLWPIHGWSWSVHIL